MTFLNKIKWILGILLVFVLIVSTNLIDKNNFTRVKDAVETIYEDRLVAKGILFNIQSAVHEKEIAATVYDSVFLTKRNNEINRNLASYILRFEETKLTRDEEISFSNLKEHLEALKRSEKAYITSGVDTKRAYLNDIATVKYDLNELSIIQLSEGEKQLFISKRAISTVELFTQIEIYLLIGLAILIQIIIMYNPKPKDIEVED